MLRSERETSDGNVLGNRLNISADVFGVAENYVHAKCIIGYK